MTTLPMRGSASLAGKRGRGGATEGHLEVEGVVGVRHQAVLVGALQLEAVGDHAIGVAVLAVAVEFGQTVAVPQLLEVLVGAVDSAGAEVLHHTWRGQRGREVRRDFSTTLVPSAFPSSLPRDYRPFVTVT